MTLPKKEEKSYLEVTKSDKGLSIVGQEEHIRELAELFSAYGIGCRVEGGTLVLAADADPARVQETLEAYQNAKGS